MNCGQERKRLSSVGPICGVFDSVRNTKAKGTNFWSFQISMTHKRAWFFHSKHLKYHELEWLGKKFTELTPSTIDPWTRKRIQDFSFHQQECEMIRIVERKKKLRTLRLTGISWPVFWKASIAFNQPMTGPLSSVEPRAYSLPFLLVSTHGSVSQPSSCDIQEASCNNITLAEVTSSPACNKTIEFFRRLSTLPFTLTITVKDSNFGPHGNFGPLFATSVRYVRLWMKQIPKMNRTEFVDLKCFYNFHSLYFSVGRVSRIASLSEK